MNESESNIVCGRPLHIVTECASTNELLRSLMEQSPLSEGYTIRAIEQTSGKGQNKNAWFSTKGQSLTLSVLFKPGFLAARELPQLSQAVGLACVQYLRSHTPEARLKWPNDLMIGAKKVGGILMESQVSGQRVSWVIAGIGLNLNQNEFPAHLPQATSLLMNGSALLDPHAECSKLLGILDALYLRLRNGGYSQILNEFSMYLMA